MAGADEQRHRCSFGDERAGGEKLSANDVRQTRRMDATRTGAVRGGPRWRQLATGICARRGSGSRSSDRSDGRIDDRSSDQNRCLEAGRGERERCALRGGDGACGGSGEWNALMSFVTSSARRVLLKAPAIPLSGSDLRPLLPHFGHGAVGIAVTISQPHRGDPA